jgi:hypothetical protein
LKLNVRQQKMPQPNEGQTTAGQDFVSRIRPAGCALFLALAVLVGAICLTAGKDPIAGYTPPLTMEDYAADPAALVQELEEHVIPALPDYTMSVALGQDGSVTVTVDSDHFVAARAAILRYFDEDLITFQRDVQ